MDWQETRQGTVPETLETSDGDVEKSGGCAEAEVWMVPLGSRIDAVQWLFVCAG